MAISSVLSLIILSNGVVSFYLVLAGLIALPLIYAILAFPKVGIVLLLSLAYVIMFFARFANGFPLGTIMDGIVVLLIIGFFLKQKYVKDWAAFREPIGIVMIIWIVYNLAEVVNPSAASTMAWLYAIRPIVLVAITYFLFYFHIRDVQFIRLLLKLWLCFSVIAALYTLKQEYFGFANFEMQWIKSDLLLTRLYYIGNHWRKFSIFSDPVSLAYNMVISSIVCFCLMTGPFATWKKMALGGLGCLFVLAMLYSGTRGAYVLFPVAYLLFSILKYNKKVMIAGICAACIMGVLIIMPTSNYTLYRFQTAFKPSKDASYLV